MILERRMKYSGGGRTATRLKEKVDLTFDITSLELFCYYIMSDNRNIRRSHIINMRNMMDIMNMDIYKNEPEKLKRIEFIKKGIEARLTFNLTRPDMIYLHIYGGVDDKSIIDLDHYKPMGNAELEWINMTISESLKYSYLYNDIDTLMDVCTRFKASEYRYRGDIVKELEGVISSIQAKLRRAKVEASTESTFSLKTGVFEECIRDLHSQLLCPSNKLQCGMQGINEMTAGGFESGRVYMLFGLPGEGKSTTLLDLAYQIKKYNKNFTVKDPSKTPCVVFLTMENTVRETVERLFNMAATPDNIINFTPEEVINLLRTDGELYLGGGSPIDIIIKFVPGDSVDTGYLYTLTEDLEDEGYEVICLIQDYVKRIKSVYNNSGDLRLELGSIVNEFKTFAAIKDIPVITASQLNRDATGRIDEGRKANKADLVRMLGRSNIGESMLMLENIDCGFMITPEYDASGNKFLGIQRIKARFKASTLVSIYQPYIPGNAISLVEDFYSAEPAYKITMRDNAYVESRFNNGGSSFPKANNIQEYNNIKIAPDKDSNIYLNAMNSINSLEKKLIKPIKIIA